MPLDRRAVLQTGSAARALQALPAQAAETADSAADTLLSRITEQLLRDYP